MMTLVAVSPAIQNEQVRPAACERATPELARYAEGVDRYAEGVHQSPERPTVQQEASPHTCDAGTAAAAAVVAAEGYGHSVALRVRG